MSSRFPRLVSLAVCAVTWASADVRSDKSPTFKGVAKRPGRVGAFSAGEYARINGALVRAKGVPMWPVFDGDRVEAVGAPAWVSLRDGSRIRLDEGSSAALKASSNTILVAIQKGSAAYVLAGRTRVSTPALSHAIVSGRGTLDAAGRIGPLEPRPSWGSSGWCDQDWLLENTDGKPYFNPVCEPCLDKPVPGESVAVCSRP